MDSLSIDVYCVELHLDWIGHASGFTLHTCEREQRNEKDRAKENPNSNI